MSEDQVSPWAVMITARRSLPKTWGSFGLHLIHPRPKSEPRSTRAQVLSLTLMADGFYVVAVRIAHEGSEVVRVVLGPQARLVKHLSTAGERGIEKSSYRRAIACRERDMRL